MAGTHSGGVRDDGLDALMRELSTNEAPVSKRSASEQQASSPAPARAAAAEGWGEEDDDIAEDEDWDNWGDEDMKVPKQERRATKERVQHYRKQIKDYILDLADPFVLKEVDSRLRARTYESVGEYYVSRPQLAEYTINSEIHRMTYTVGYHKAVLATKPEDVRRVYNEHSDALIWRFANQSIWGDVLQELQGRFLRSDLCIGVVSRESSFHLDLADDAMTATSLFAIIIAASPVGEGVSPTSAVELATIRGNVAVSASEEKLCQSVELGALRVIFDDTIDAVAMALAEDEARQGSPHPDEAQAGFYGYTPGFVPLASTSAAALSAVRDQIVTAANLRTVTLAGQGLFQRGRQVVSSLGTMIEEAANAVNEEGRSADSSPGPEGADGARGGGKVWRSELLGAKGAAMVAAKGEGVLEGIVGGIGSLVRADSDGDEKHGRVAGASSGMRLYRSQEDEKAEEEERKRREAAAKLEAAARALSSSTPPWPSTSSATSDAGLFTGLRQLAGASPSATACEPQAQPEGPLPPPPSARLKGLFTGIGGFIASTVERVVSDEAGGGAQPGAEGLTLYRRDEVPRLYEGPQK